MMMRSVVGKLWVATVSLVLVILIVLGIFLSQMFENFYINQKAHQLIRDGIGLSELIATDTEEELAKKIPTIAHFIQSDIMLVDIEGRVETCSMTMGMEPGTRLAPEEVAEVLSGRIVARHGYYERFKRPLLSVAVPVYTDGRVTGAIMLNAPLEPITRTIHSLRMLILYGAAGAVLLATLLGFFVSRTLSSPLLEMNKVALAMAGGDFRGGAPSRGQDEIGTLGRTLNFLSGELSRNIRALSREKDQLANVLASMTDGVITFDADGRVILSNPPARELLAPEGNGFDALDDLPPAVGELFRAVLATGERQYGEFPVGQRVIAARLAACRDGSGEVEAVVAVFQDVTRERRLEELRRDFVATVSHELRTPLTLAQGYAEALRDDVTVDPAQRRECLEIILDETNRLRRLVDDLLDLSLLEKGQLALDKGPVDLAAVARRVIGKVAPAARLEGKDITVTTEGVLPLAYGDEDRLEQVLFNLVDNALRHSPAGSPVRVTLSRDGDAARVTVADDGPGIPERDLPFIWQRFYRVNKARTRSDGGTGLGLAIVKNLVEAHGGRVSVESEPGRGAVFGFTVPLWRPEG